MHSPHSVQENILRFRPRGLRRMGQELSQALLQEAQDDACETSNPTAIALELDIQARL